MRVLLVNPPTLAYKNFSKTYSTLPNGILYIASILEKHGHDVQIYDSVVDSRKPVDFVGFKPQIIGFSVITGPYMEAAITQSIEFKKLIPGVKVVWGNVHPSILPEQTLVEPYIDYVVIGAGEYTLLELVEYLGNGDNKLDKIKGLAYEIDGRIIINKPRPFINNLDELPDPAWHLVDINKYTNITLNTGRGCHFRCTFCYNTAYHRGYKSASSAEKIVTQIQHLKERYGVKKIRFFEDNFTFNRQRLQKFCNLLINRQLKVKWECDSRADLEEEDIVLMARSGCISVGMGMETGSQRMLNFLKKGTSVTKMEKTFWYFVKHKITPLIYIMYGLPTETITDFRMTHELLERLDNPPFMYNRFIPCPGTTLFEYCTANGQIAPPKKLIDWVKFTIESFNNVNLSEVPQEMIDEAIARFRITYASRRFRFTLRHNPSYFWIILRDPLEFFRMLKGLIKSYFMILSKPATSSTV